MRTELNLLTPFMQCQGTRELYLARSAENKLGKEGAEIIPLALGVAVRVAVDVAAPHITLCSHVILRAQADQHASANVMRYSTLSANFAISFCTDRYRECQVDEVPGFDFGSCALMTRSTGAG